MTSSFLLFLIKDFQRCSHSFRQITYCQRIREPETIQLTPQSPNVVKYLFPQNPGLGKKLWRRLFCVLIVAFRGEAWSPLSSLRVGTGVKPGGFPSQATTLAKSTFSEGNLSTSGRTPPTYSLFKLQPQFTEAYMRLSIQYIREVGDSRSFPVSQCSLGNLDRQTLVRLSLGDPDWSKRNLLAGGFRHTEEEGVSCGDYRQYSAFIVAGCFGDVGTNIGRLDRVFPNSNRKACSCPARTLC